MFEQATRLKLRFDTPRGLLTVEDLWDVPLTSARTVNPGPNLNDIAKSLNREIKSAAEEDFVNPVSAATAVAEMLQLKFNIVKHIITVRQAEHELVKLAADKRVKKARLLELIAERQDDQLKSSSVEQLQEMIAAL